MHAEEEKEIPSPSPTGSGGGIGFGNPLAHPPQAGVLGAWRENLAILSANRTKGDEAVITKLGDRLWAEHTEPYAAQVCSHDGPIRRRKRRYILGRDVCCMRPRRVVGTGTTRRQ